MIVSAIEHDAVLEAAEVLRHRGIEVLFVKPDKRGVITPEALAHVLDAATDPLLVSIMALNNETGALNDIAQLAELAHRSGALFHSRCYAGVRKDAALGEADRRGCTFALFP